MNRNHRRHALLWGSALLVASTHALAQPAGRVYRIAHLCGSGAMVSKPLLDAFRAGIVQSLARPGGNITGVSSNLPALVDKQVQLLKETLPALQRVALPWTRRPRPSPSSCRRQPARLA